MTAAACSLGDMGDIGDVSGMDADVLATALEVDVQTGQWLVCAAMASRWGR